MIGTRKFVKDWTPIVTFPLTCTLQQRGVIPGFFRKTKKKIQKKKKDSLGYARLLS